MTTALSQTGHPRSLYLVPDDHVLRLIREAERTLVTVTTIPLAKRLIAQAEAVSLLAEKLATSDRIQAAAVRLRIQAEAQLGSVTRAIPTLRGVAAKMHPDQATKGATLREHKLTAPRVSVAEGLSRLPQRAIDAAIAETPKPSLNAVVERLGLRKDHRTKRSSPSRVRDRLVAAIALLERCHRAKRPPTMKEIDGVRS